MQTWWSCQHACRLNRLIASGDEAEWIQLGWEARSELLTPSLVTANAPLGLLCQGAGNLTMRTVLESLPGCNQRICTAVYMQQYASRRSHNRRPKLRINLRSRESIIAWKDSVDKRCVGPLRKGMVHLRRQDIFIIAWAFSVMCSWNTASARQSVL